MAPMQRRVLIIGGSFGGLACGRDLHNHFLVTIVDAKEFFEYTPGVLRAYVKPRHLDALTFTLYPVIEERMMCKYIWGEVKELHPDRTCVIKPMFSQQTEMIDFDYCIIACGCNFNVLHPKGESLWFPTVHEEGRETSLWKHLDERFLEGRRRHILEEYASIQQMSKTRTNVLVVGAGFIGVEWVTELEHFFPDKGTEGLQLGILDFLPQCLGPLPAKAAAYCSKYMKKKGIKESYETKYAPGEKAFWKKVGLDHLIPKDIKCDDGKASPELTKAMEAGGSKNQLKIYSCMGVKPSNYFMPEETKSFVGPGGGGWIMMDITLAVTTRDGNVWSVDDKGYPRIYAIGDCNYACVAEANKAMPDWPIPPIAKISYPGEEEGIVACVNIHKTDKIQYHSKKVDAYGFPLQLSPMHWPWGAGMFATSLGPDDACFVAGANWVKNSGVLCVWGSLCAVQKEIIEASKTDECAFGLIGRLIWYFVHHTPLHLWGGGPRFGY